MGLLGWIVVVVLVCILFGVITVNIN